MVKKRAKRNVKKRKKVPTWEEALEHAFRHMKPVLDKLRDYNLGKVCEEEIEECENQ